MHTGAFFLLIGKTAVSRFPPWGGLEEAFYSDSGGKAKIRKNEMVFLDCSFIHKNKSLTVCEKKSNSKGLVIEIAKERIHLTAQSIILFIKSLYLFYC